MRIKIIKHPLINKWERACGLDLGKIASAAAHACNTNIDAVAYQPTWPQETASTQENIGMTIYLEQPLFLDPHTDKNVLFKRNFYLHGHEFSHPIEERFGLGKWFRYDVCLKPYTLDISSLEGFEQACEMSEKDTVIDSKLVDNHKLFAEGFLETHIISAITDSMWLSGRRLKRKPDGSLKLYRNTSLEDILTLELSTNRQIAITNKITLASRQNLRYQEFSRYIKQQNEALRRMLRYPELQDLHDAIKKHYIRTALKKKDRNETLMELIQQMKNALSNN